MLLYWVKINRVQRHVLTTMRSIIIVIIIIINLFSHCANSCHDPQAPIMHT